MRLEPEIDQLGMLSVVVVLFGLDARIGKTLDFDIQSELGACGLHQFSKFQYGELFRELVVDPAFSRSRRVQTGQLDATNGIADIEEGPSLAAFAVNGEG